MTNDKPTCADTWTPPRIVGYANTLCIATNDGTLTGELYLSNFVHPNRIDAEYAGKRLPNWRGVVALVELNEGSERT